jgi:exopolyphosphatase/guanosine-5'-triphosphate,3'-diphosphate pyrophosphatase
VAEVPDEGGPRSPVAAIDCGTNTIKLLIGDLPDVAVREMRIIRLGQGVDATGRLADDALERAFAALDEYAALVREHGATRLRFCATSATRDAENSEVFVEAVRARLGVTPEVLTGAEEAALAFDGAIRHLRDEPALPVLVVDIGGGSTELIRGASLTAPPSAAHSMDIGSVRMHERHLRSDPPTMAQVTACVSDIDRHLDACPVSPARAATVVGVAGTVTSVAAGVLDLPAYDRDAVDQAVLPVEEVHAMVDRLVGMTIAERLALPWLHPGRADVIGAGALILSRVLRRTTVDTMVVSEADILDGIAWSLV